MWVRQPTEEINLLVVLGDDTVRDLYLCSVLKFLSDLLLDTPSDDVMTSMLGIREPMCEKEKVYEIGATEDEMTERLEIYEHNRAYLIQAYQDVCEGV